MAFKRSAVRSRLSPPNRGSLSIRKALKTLGFAVFLRYCGKNLKNELSSLWNGYNTPDAELNESELYDFLQKSAQGELTAYFENFSENLFQTGNLAKNLLNFLETLQ